MLRTLFSPKKTTYRSGQVVELWSGMPSKKLKERYQLGQLVRYNPADQLAEFRVTPVDVSQDPGNLTDGHGHAAKGLR